MDATQGRKPNKMTLEQFKARKEAPEIQAILGRLNGGSFMECHTAIFRETGIWIEELVPVFEKLDAALLVKDLPAPLR